MNVSHGRFYFYKQKVRETEDEETITATMCTDTVPVLDGMYGRSDRQSELQLEYCFQYNENGRKDGISYWHGM